ncbi:MAG: protein translocase subunit SecD [Planctomycetota bacterium]|jgi:SecD/SecF fusion protein
MKNIGFKLICILALLALCAWSVFPPKERIRLGKDLRGGVSLIYHVDIPDGITDRAGLVTQTIQVLKERVNPKGVFDISIQPLGQDRIEVVMPLPTAEVRALQDAYRAQLDELLAEAQIIPMELDTALEAGTAIAKYCGDDRDSIRCGQISDLQAAWDKLQEVTRLLEANTDVSQTPILEDKVAAADINLETLREAALRLSLDRARVVRVLGLSPIATPARDDQGNELLDPATGEPQMQDAPRMVSLNALRGEFPSAAGKLESVVAAFDAYEARRTGLDDPEDLKRLLRGSGVLQFHITVSTSDESGVPVEELRRSLLEVGPANVDSSRGGWYPLNELKQWYEEPADLARLEANPRAYFEGQGYVVERYEGEYFMLVHTSPMKAMTHGDPANDWTVTQTYPSLDRLGRQAVAFELDALGGGKMGRLTGSHVGERMAIVLDGEVYSAPVLQSQISNSGIITGTFSQAEISYLTRVLAAGSLGARLGKDPISTNVLGPSIGADNLNRGTQAFLWAIIAVAIFMLLYYFVAGVVADIALAANGLIIFGLMAMIDGTFTLPGLAGIVLTIGMAVDANVLIYERIREEMFSGEDDLRTAIRVGYAKALSTIIDANVTNLIVCFVLFKTATAEVKGFALTLTIGICATLFTALFVTRVVYAIYTDIFKAQSLPMLPTTFPAIHRLLEPSINWIGLRKGFWVVSAVAVVGSLFLVSMRGVDMFDTEFRGGVKATMLTRAVDPEAGGAEPERIWLSQAAVEERVRGIADDLPSDATDRERRVLTELVNADILTQGVTQTGEDGGVTATSFQIKVANPKGLEENDSIADSIVDAIVAEFASDIEISPSLAFDQMTLTPAEATRPIEDASLGQVISGVTSSVRVSDFRGGVAMHVTNIDPPVSAAEVGRRIEQMRGMPDYAETSGRATRVVGVDPVAAPDGAQRAVVVLVHEPSLSSYNVSDEVWFRSLATKEWEILSQSLQRKSSLKEVATYSSSVAGTLAANAVVAVAMSLLGILLYIWMRFGSLRYSAAAITALLHDVCIALGLLAASSMLASTGFGRALGLEDFRIDLGVVAALLTIIGYSLNDTIVILDRIRENRGKRPLANASIVNRSINQTVSRTLLTSVTTLMAVLIMYVAGGSGMRPFTFTLLIGLIVGTYSSVAIAAPLVFYGSGDLTSAPEPDSDTAEPSPTVA